MTRRRPIEMRTYRCYFHPCSRSGAPIPNETGVLPSVDVQAPNQRLAEKQAFAQVKFPITETERLDDVKAPKPAKAPRATRQRKPASLEALGLVTAASLLAKESS